MGIKIGDKNVIKNSIIAERITNTTRKQSFFEKHPLICGFLISLLAGIILLFSFWSKAINVLEGWLGG